MYCQTNYRPLNTRSIMIAPGIVRIIPDDVVIGPSVTIALAMHQSANVNPNNVASIALRSW